MTEAFDKAQERKHWKDLLEAEGMPAELPFEHAQLEDHNDALDRAGVDDGTDADMFMQMNGRNIFVTGEELHGAQEGVLD